MVMLKVDVRLIAEKFSRLTWEECGPCSDFAHYTLAFALQLRAKARIVEKCQMGTIQCVEMAAWFRGPGSTYISAQLNN